jgi:hypothetical protein
VYLLVGVSVAGALLKEKEPRVQAVFFLTLALVVVSALRGTWRKLAPAAAPRSITLRGLLVAGWMAAYLAFILFIGVAAQDLGLETWVTPGLLVVAWLVGTVTFVTGAATRFSRARHRGATAPGGIWSFRALAGVVAEALTLPFRHPVTLLPFLFASGVAYLLRLVIHVEVPVPTDAASAVDVTALWKSMALSIGLNAPFFLFAANATTELVSQYECGLDADLRRAVRRAGSRLPAGLLAMLLQVIGLTVGAILLIIPALILFVRWIFVPHAIVLAQDNALQAFRTSSRVTAGHGWRVFLLLVLIGLWNFSLYRTLSMLPTIGSFLISWLDFSWLAVATTLLYLRGGGPHALSSRDAHLTQVV